MNIRGVFAVCSICVLSACGGSGPSEKEMATVIKNYAEFMMGGDYDVSVKKDSCEKESDDIFRCAVTVASQPRMMLDGNRVFKFQKTGDRWKIINN